MTQTIIYSNREAAKMLLERLTEWVVLHVWRFSLEDIFTFKGLIGFLFVSNSF